MTYLENIATLSHGARQKGLHLVSFEVHDSFSLSPLPLFIDVISDHIMLHTRINKNPSIFLYIAKNLDDMRSHLTKNKHDEQTFNLIEDAFVIEQNLDAYLSLINTNEDNLMDKERELNKYLSKSTSEAIVHKRRVSYRGSSRRDEIAFDLYKEAMLA